MRLRLPPLVRAALRHDHCRRAVCRWRGDAAGADCTGAALKLAAAILAVTLTACTAIDTHRQPPADWPNLEVTVQKVGFWELQRVCGGNLITQYFGCAWIYFATMVCNVFYAADDESAVYVIEHEKMHCRGHDHIGSSMLADGWEKWKKENGK